MELSDKDNFIKILSFSMCDGVGELAKMGENFLIKTDPVLA